MTAERFRIPGDDWFNERGRLIACCNHHLQPRAEILRGRANIWHDRADVWRDVADIWHDGAYI